MIAVAGPRIDPASLPRADGLEVHGYVHELYRHLAACDVAVVQGGLTTTMELVAARRPFVSLPLASHFEQRFHVRHRLDRYGARSWLEYQDATPEALADAMADEVGSEPSTSRSSREARRGPLGSSPSCCDPAGAHGAGPPEPRGGRTCRARRRRAGSRPSR